jgi:hypothetical protein
MREAECERRHGRYRNEKAGREKKVSLETSPPDEKLSKPFWPPFFSTQWRGKMERFLQNPYTKHLQTPHVRLLWRGFAPGSSNSPRKESLSSPPGAHVRSTSFASSHFYPYLYRFMYSSACSHHMNLSPEKKMEIDDAVTFLVGPFSGVKP